MTPGPKPGWNLEASSPQRLHRLRQGAAGPAPIGPGAARQHLTRIGERGLWTSGPRCHGDPFPRRRLCRCPIPWGVEDRENFAERSPIKGCAPANPDIGNGSRLIDERLAQRLRPTRRVSWSLIWGFSPEMAQEKSSKKGVDRGDRDDYFPPLTDAAGAAAGVRKRTYGRSRECRFFIGLTSLIRR